MKKSFFKISTCFLLVTLCSIHFLFAGDEKCITPKETVIQNILVLAPIVLILIITLWLLSSIRKNKDFFSSLFMDKKPETIAAFIKLKKELFEPNSLSPPADPVVSPEPEVPGSSSRVIMFLSGMAAVLISSVLVSFYIYYSLENKSVPDLNELLYVLLALGIGVVPYTVNKFKEK